MNIDHYRAYSTEDFILDENLRKLAKGQSIDGITLDRLKAQLPEKNNEIRFAVEIINGLSTTRGGVPIERKAELLTQIFEHKKNKLKLTFFRYAVSVLLIVGLGVSAFLLFNRPPDVEDFACSSNVKSKNAELILADGKRVEIESKQSKIEYTANGTSVSLNDSAKLEQVEPAFGKSYNQVVVPFGKRSNILLSDGTRVWLNSGSRLVYPPVFDRKNREVFLEGEAYFEVSKDAHKPFYVRTEAFKVRVLGTKFNVQAYKNESVQNAVLIEGKVSLAANGKLFSKEYELSPNQKGAFSGGETGFEITDIEDAQNYIAWINGYLSFENEDITSLSKKISRYYNLEIEVKISNDNLKLSGKLDLKEDPERILEELSILFKAKCTKRGDKVVIYE
jgi:transmembrane sensor